MPTLYLVDGTGGAGKSDFIGYCTKKNPLYNSLIKKYTTKENHNYGDGNEDLIYCNLEEYTNVKSQCNKYFEYQFPATSTVNYLISKNDIDKALQQYKNVYLIVRSVDVIIKIKKEYEKYYNINIVTLFLYCDEQITKKRIIHQLSELQVEKSKINELVEKRTQNNRNCLYQYMDSFEMNIYNYLILNSIDSESYKKCLNKLLNMYENFDEKFSPLKAFIIMPFLDGREWIHYYEVSKAIILGAKKQGFIAYRQDSKQNNEIIEGVKESIKENYLFIVDLSSSRQNCYYELGLVDAYPNEKHTILLKEKDEHLAFDLQGRFCHEYSYYKTDYESIVHIVSSQIERFIREHIFITYEIANKIRNIKES